MNVYAKQKQTQKYGKQTCGYQWGERRGEGQIRDMRLICSNYYV